MASTGANSPRARGPNKENRTIHDTRPTTPTMAQRVEIDSVSPTANLKLLTDMASLKQSSERTDVDVVAAKKATGNRKDKSLALLCTNFLKKYREYPEAGSFVTISLDEAAKQLDVERRRIYDIVNVFESIEMMSRIAKNCYRWYGKYNQTNVLTRLALLGRAEKLDEHFEAASAAVAFRLANRPSSPWPCPSPIEMDSCDNSTDGSSISSSVTASPALVNEPILYLRKEKSLGLMSLKFIKLFLAVTPNVVCLDVAARVFVGETTTEELMSTAYKTKVRRLYDIANILTSLKLIRKVAVDQRFGRKPAFEYIGPAMDCISSSSLSGGNASRFKRSLSDVPPASNFPRTRSEMVFRSPHLSPSPSTTTFSRRASLEDLCQVATAQLTPKTTTSSNKRQTTAILMTHDGNPIHVITITTPSISSTDHVTLQVVSKPPSGSASSSSAVAQPTSATGGQLLFEVPLVLQISKPAASQEKQNETEYRHVLINSSGDGNHRRRTRRPSAAAAAAATKNTDLTNVAIISPNVLAPTVLNSELRRPFHDLASASTTSTPARNHLQLKPVNPTATGSAPTPVIRYHRSESSSPSAPGFKRSSETNEGQTQYSIVSKKLRM